MRRSNNRKTMSYFRDKWLSERAEASFGADASDYSTIFMPWGPKWNAKNIAKMVRACVCAPPRAGLGSRAHSCSVFPSPPPIPVRVCLCVLFRCLPSLL